MNEQFLQELRQYLQKHSEELACVMKPDECYDFSIMEEDLPRPTRAQPQAAIPKIEQPQFDGGFEGQQAQEIKKLNIVNRCFTPHKQEHTQNISYSARPETDIEEYIRKSKNNETFSTKLLKYIDQTGLADAEIYKRAGIDRRHFSKIRCDKDYRPKKATAVALCLALELKLVQAEELLELAGYSLSNSDTGDLIVKFCIEKGKYALMDVNEALVYFGVKAIGVVG